MTETDKATMTKKSFRNTGRKTKWKRIVEEGCIKALYTEKKEGRDGVCSQETRRVKLC